MRFLSYLSLIAVGALLIYASAGLPYRGDSDSAVNREKSPSGSTVASSYYIKNAYNDTKTPNLVTSVLGDYRSFDTLGEEAVIFTAGIICYLLLRREKKRETRQ